MKRIVVYIILILGIFCTAILYSFGRSYWYPIYLKIRGAKTIVEVVEIIRGKNEFSYDFDQWESLTLLCFKEERIIEVWANGKSSRKKAIIQTFPFTGFSGKLGPKLRQGDRQIPEGIYRIEYLNPNSSYHLSMKVDYPNEFDERKGRFDGRKRLGGNIFIHGKSATIGCIPIGDANIEALFFMVAEMGISNVAVIISPYDMRSRYREIEIPEIDWEDELYAEINTSLKPYSNQ